MAPALCFNPEASKMIYLSIAFKVTVWTVIFTFRLALIIFGALLRIGQLYDVQTTCAVCGAPVKASMVNAGGGCARCARRGASGGKRRAASTKGASTKGASSRTSSGKSGTRRAATPKAGTRRTGTQRRQPSSGRGKAPGAGPSHPAARWDLF